MTTLYEQIQIRRGTAAEWAARETILAEGEFGYERDTGLVKVGDGATPWSLLDYFGLSRAQIIASGLTAGDVGAIATSAAGVAGGVAQLDGTGKIPAAQLPALVINETYTVASQSAMLALAANVGDTVIRSDVSETFILAATPATTLGNWKQLLSPTSAVSSVAGRTGAVTLSTSDISGLGTAATRAVGVVTGTVADGGDSRFPPTPAAGNAGKVVTVNAASNGFELDTPTAAISTVTATLPANTDATFSTGAATSVVSISLPVGTWLVDTSAVVLVPSANSQADLWIAVSSGTASLDGTQATTVETTSGSTIPVAASFRTKVTVTAAAVIALMAQAGAGTGWKVRANSLVQVKPATSLIAEKVA